MSRARVDPAVTRIDNQYYDQLGDEWWDPRGRAGGLHALNGTRAGYYQSVFEAAGGTLHGVSLVDVGCGGGILAEELARRGARVTGVDRSQPSLSAARRHFDPTRGGEEPRYACADAGSLPFADGSFDALVSSDFLEHVHDLDATVREMARVVRPGGWVCFETINRTLRARIVVIWLMEIVFPRIPRHTHDWKLFVTPAEVEASMRRAGLEPKEIRGLHPPENPVSSLWKIARGKDLPFAITDDTSISFVGYARKPA